MVNILPIASGKGGVGKSAVSVNVAVSLAQKGKKVILCDFDFGGANLHTLLGLKNNQAGMGNFFYRQISDLSSILQETGIENLQFIAGDCLFPGTANMDFFMKKKIMKEIFKKVAQLNTILDKYDFDVKVDWAEYTEVYGQYFGMMIY